MVAVQAVQVWAYATAGSSVVLAGVIAVQGATRLVTRRGRVAPEPYPDAAPSAVLAGALARDEEVPHPRAEQPARPTPADLTV
jgi:hypothetical protein